MKKKIIILVIIILTFTVIAFQCLLKPEHHVYEPAPITERITESGKVVGFIENNNSHAWLGIPYAKAPVGELRWRTPRPAGKWEGLLEAVEVSPICPQFGGPMSNVSMLDYNEPTGDEDCLFLNIWAPAFKPDAIPGGKERLPVMLWIHGGGNSVGQGGTYNGRVLAEKYKVIVVTFNYRLGPLGWFAHPALRGKGTTPEDRSGNYCILDIVRALTWVRDNIANFGGDRGNVTVFGESAGGMNTMMMLLCPMAKGLFHKAICQSGLTYTTIMSKGENYIDAADPGHKFSSREVINKLLIADDIVQDRKAAKAHQKKMSSKEISDYLYSKSPEEIINTYKPGAAGMIVMPKQFRDGAVLPEGHPTDIFKNKNRYNAVPIILGTNRDENKLFMSMDPDYAGLLGVKDQQYYDMVARFLSEGWKSNGADEIAIIMRKTQGSNVYVYRFDWDEEPSYPGIDMSKLIGAAHALEIPFVFNDFEALLFGFGFFFSDDDYPVRKTLADRMSSYWAEFAYNSSPGKGRDGSEIEWKAWNNSVDGKKYIIFDTPQDRGIRMSTDAVRLADLKKRIVAETGFKTQKDHCKVYVWTFGKQKDWDDNEYKNLGKEGCGEYPKESLEW